MTEQQTIEAIYESIELHCATDFDAKVAAKAAYAVARDAVLEEAIGAIQELAFSADNDLECAKLDGLTDAIYQVENLRAMKGTKP